MPGFVLLCALLVAGAIHARLRSHSRPKTAELMLTYVLAGYCGVLQIIMGSMMLRAPNVVAAHVGYPAGNPLEVWAAFLLLGGGIVGLLAIWLRGTYLVAPVVLWSVFFFGATYAHLHADLINGHDVTGERALWTFAAHGLVSVVLIALLVLQRRGASRGGLAVPA